MSATGKRKDPASSRGEAIALASTLGTLVVVVGAIWGAAHLGARMAGLTPPPTHPLELVFGLIRGEVAWPTQATVVVVAFAAILVAVLIMVLIGRRKRQVKSSRVDSAAVHMGRGRDIADLSSRSAAEKAKRLGVSETTPGVPIGRTVATNSAIFGSWEDMHIDVWGPRQGKTTSRAILAILEAPGAVFGTSNKRDLSDATRDIRSRIGTVWVFDPQGIAREEATWWWNPLSYVTDEVRASKLAEHFASGSRDAGARTDAFFDSAGQDLLAGLLLAAALGNRPITDVYVWLTEPTNEIPVDILRDHGFQLTAAQVFGVIASPDKQRGGVYGTAQQMAACLTNRQIAEWVTPAGKPGRPEFNPEEFVAEGTGTLYSLSKEGKGTAGPIVTALTVAVAEAAEDLASRSSGGRLATPLVGVLDEAANVCRWRELPNLYSHYGSRGIILLTFLQSWSQGVEVWGETGMKKLWSAANIKVYGGNVSETAFLEDLSRLIGDYDRISSSTSVGKGNRTRSHQVQRERILDVADLGALPKGRAIVIGAGSVPTLIRTTPYQRTRHKADVDASIRAHDPQAERTIAEGQKELEIVDALESVE